MGSQQQEAPHKDHHFLLVTLGAQGQINPARHLAHCLAQLPGVHVTIATPKYSHRRMFPDDKEQEGGEILINEEKGQLVSFAAYSDGYDQGFHMDVHNSDQYLAQIKILGAQTLGRLARFLSTHGRPVTCIIYTIVTEWAADVAEDLGMPSVLYWIQPAAVFAIFYRYFQQGCSDLLAAHKNDPSFTLNLRGLPPLQIRDLPSMLQDTDNPFLSCFKNIMNILEKAQKNSNTKPTVLINTFHALEAEVISATTSSDDLNLITVGPLVNEATSTQGKGKDLFEQDGSEYMKWLDNREARSVVYISFGSLTGLSKVQMDEISQGLKESGKPYLWVVRRDVREKMGGEIVKPGDDSEGMVVEWCDQLRVLSHPSVGCFVTHGGWNSTMESIVSGVPMVVLPGWADQATNAKLVEGVWGIGLRAEVNGEGVMEGGELKRCLDVIMGGDEEFSKKAGMWKDKASEAFESGNLVKFVDEFGM